MAAGGYKEFVAGEVLDEDDINDYLMQGVLVFAGTAARGSAITAPVEGQFAFLKDTDTLTYYSGSAWEEFSSGFSAAKTSGTATGSFTDGNSVEWDYFDFTGNGSFVVTDAGWADLLVVGGGGSGRTLSTLKAGGGGGAVRFGMFYLSAGTVTVTVGAGGSGVSSNDGIAGGASSFGSILKAGGGGPGFGVGSASTNSRSGFGGGGSGGGWSVNNNTTNNGGGAGGLVYGANAHDGVSLNYTGTSLEFGRGGTTDTVTANRGQGGDLDVDGSAGSAGRVVVKVKK
jgi:hypothetical protein